MSLRVIIADDHTILREGLKALLVTAGYLVVGEAADGRAAARLAKSLHPDVVLMDLSMPHLNGMDGAMAIHKDAPDTRLIALTVHTDDSYVLEALRSGFRGYVVKSEATSDLVEAIEQVAHGSIYLSPIISPSILESFTERRETEARTLTAREREVLQLVAEGKRSKEIADLLGISVKTAETHRAHIMSKLSIHDTAGLVRYAIRCGMVSP